MDWIEDTESRVVWIEDTFKYLKVDCIEVDWIEDTESRSDWIELNRIE